MALKMTIWREEFHKRMLAIRPNNFSREGLDILFDMLSNTESDIEFDPIAICCEYAENTIDELLDSYDELEECVADYATEHGISADDVSADEIADIFSQWTYAESTGADMILYEQY